MFSLHQDRLHAGTVQVTSRNQPDAVYTKEPHYPAACDAETHPVECAVKSKEL
jgi:hypothetical protein